MNRKQGLENLKKTAEDFINKLDRLTGTEKRNLLEKLIEKVVINQNQSINVHFWAEPASANKAVMRWKQSTEREVNGATDGA